MKQFIITLLSGYQVIISPFLHQLLGMDTLCRYPLSCSAYAKETIKKEGVVQGGRKAVLRLLHCHPFATTYGQPI